VLTINVLEYFEKVGYGLHRDRPMVVEKDRTLTFRDVHDRAQSLAAALLTRRDLFNESVAVYLPRSADVVVANIGVLYSGNFYMNLDTASPMPRTRAILNNVQPELVITGRKLVAALLEAGFVEDQIILIDELDDAPPPTSEVERLGRRRATLIDTDPICIINTSGSTGIPKAVLISHRGIVDFVEWAIDRYGLDHTRILGNQSPFYFDIYIFELVLCMATGSTLVILPAELFPFPARLLQHMTERKINFIFWVPTIMVNIANLNLLGEYTLPELENVWFAGEVFPTRPFNYWRRHLPHALFSNLYGPIEISLDCTFYDVDREFQDDEPLPIGHVCRNTGILILTDDDRAAAPGDLGELAVRGSGLALGYYNDFERTAKVFCQNPLNRNYPELIYRTGDLVYVNDRGEIFFAGRKDFQIKHQGYRIELGEIENAAMGCTEIHNCCAHYNKNKKEIVLFYESDAELRPDRIRTDLAKQLPKYMIPTVFRHLKSMPMNPNGKIDRRLLLDHLGEQ
jgi:D-alanine--poly(phosphoribitol) ligase subunit 1